MICIFEMFQEAAVNIVIDTDFTGILINKIVNKL